MEAAKTEKYLSACCLCCKNREFINRHYLREVSETVKPEMMDTHICRDKDDIKILETALSGNVRFIITGDDDLLVLKRYEGIEIITPREFWNRLKGQ